MKKREKTSRIAVIFLIVLLLLVGHSTEVLAQDQDMENMTIIDIEDELRFRGLRIDRAMLDMLKEIEWQRTINPDATEDEIIALLDEEFEISTSGSIYKIWSNLTDDEKELITSNPYKAILTWNTQNKAFELTETHMGEGGYPFRSRRYHMLWW